jgi:hypothetical protein
VLQELAKASVGFGGKSSEEKRKVLAELQKHRPRNLGIAPPSSRLDSLVTFELQANVKRSEATFGNGKRLFFAL